MIDESRAHGLQAMYLAGAVGALQALGEALTEIAERIAWAWVVKMHLPVGRERVEEIAHDAASKLVERYMRDPAFRVRHFSVLLKHRVRDELFISPRQRQRTFEARIVFKDDLPSRGCEEVAEARGDSAMELAESHSKGKKVVADLCRSRSYRQAIRRVGEYVERRWIYDHAEALHEVYRALHRREGKARSVRRSGLDGVRRQLLHGQRTKQEFSRE